MSNLLREGEKILAEHKKFPDLTALEVFLESTSETTLRLERWQLKMGETTREWGGAVRAIVDGGVGFSTFSTLDLGFKAVKAARDNAKAAPPNKYITLPHVSGPPEVSDIYDPEVEHLDIDYMSEVLLQLQEPAKQKLHSVIALMRTVVREIGVLNTQGVEYSSKSSKISLSGDFKAKKGDTITSGVVAEYGASLNPPLPASKLGEKAVEDAQLQLKTMTLRSENMTIILDPLAVRELFGWVLAPEFLGNNVLKKSSPFVDKLGETIASEQVTLKDEGLNSSAFYPSGFDDEGHPRQTTTVVEKGVLKSFLHDSTSAKEAKTDSTGNSGRFSVYARRNYAFPPTCSTNSLTFQPGTAKKEQMVEDVKYGIYLTYPIGAHSGNVASGVFNIAPYICFLIENGEKVGGIKKFVFSSNTPEILKKITQVGEDVKSHSIEWNEQVSGPHLKIEDVKIVG